MLLKLKIFNRKSDPHSFRTVIGDPVSIWELHFMLKTTPRSDGLTVQRMEVSDLDGTVLDPSEGLSLMKAHATPLSYGDAQ